MPKPSRYDRLDLAIEAILPRPEAASLPDPKTLGAGLALLLRIAGDLAALPRQDFKLKLKQNLERSYNMENAAKQATETTASQPYRTITPYIIVPRAAEFIDFLTEAFDAKERFRMPIQPDSPLLMHAEVQIGNGTIELADSNEQIPPAPQTIHLYLDDADAFYQRAINAGASSIYPFGDHVSGDRQGAVRDPFGNIW